jgi:hypothetical protein
MAHDYRINKNEKRKKLNQKQNHCFQIFLLRFPLYLKMNPRIKNYKTLDNGGHPFKVQIFDGTGVAVWRRKQKGANIDISYTLPYFHFMASKIFIGTSPLNATTRASAGFGPEWDGNSFILQKEGDEATNDYYHVGYEIFKFRALAPIIFYTSPVGNSAVPYPWAQDAKGNFYLMIENTVLTKISHQLPIDAPIQQKEQFDPYYAFWFKQYDGCEDTGFCQFSIEHPVTKKVYKFDWQHNPEEAFDRQMKYSRNEDQLGSLELGKDLWCKVIRTYGEQTGIVPLQIIEKIEGRIV